MPNEMGPADIEAALRATGELLAADGHAVQDLIAMAPDDVELREAAAWVRGQDAAPEFPAIVEEVLAHVRRNRRAD